jgi:hypothetical protein
MRTSTNAQAKIVHSDDFSQSTVLCVVQLKTAILGWNLQAESSKIPKCVQSGLIDGLRSEIKEKVERLRYFIICSKLTAVASFFAASLTSKKNFVTGSMNAPTYSICSWSKAMGNGKSWEDST